jgi:hypothetical protein
MRARRLADIGGQDAAVRMRRSSGGLVVVVRLVYLPVRLLQLAERIAGPEHLDRLLTAPSSWTVSAAGRSP